MTPFKSDWRWSSGRVQLQAKCVSYHRSEQLLRQSRDMHRCHLVPSSNSRTSRLSYSGKRNLLKPFWLRSMCNTNWVSDKLAIVTCNSIKLKGLESSHPSPESSFSMQEQRLRSIQTHRPTGFVALTNPKEVTSMTHKLAKLR